jgi:DNA uptake protein ComE-like DNA-binding protein
VNATAWLRHVLVESPAMSPSVLAAPDPQTTVVHTPAGTHTVTRLTDDELDKKKKLLRHKLNTLDAKKLQTLPSIGAKLAATIVEFRKTKGLFAEVEDVGKVPGLKYERFAAANLIR